MPGRAFPRSRGLVGTFGNPARSGPLVGMSDSALATPPPVSRLSGIDLARGLALIGMLMVHFGPKGETDLLGRLYALPHGRASVLFVLVAGIGVALLSRRAEARGDARLRLFCFALFLLPLGLMLEALHHPVAVILHHYAGFYLFAIAVLGLPARWLGWLAALASVIGPLVFFAGRLIWPDVFSRQSVELGDAPGHILLALTLTGPYPLVVWAAPLLWGLWLGRQDLRSSGLSRRLVWIGSALALVAIAASELLFGALGEPRTPADWRFVFADTAHSQMPLWMIGAIGSAAAMVGLALLAAERWPRLVHAGAMLGQMALTVYVLHVLSLWLIGRWLRHDEVIPAIASVAVFVALATVYALLWRRRHDRGPIEQMMHAVWEAALALRGLGEPAPRKTEPAGGVDVRPVA